MREREQISQDYIVDLTKKLVRIPSTHFNPQALNKVLTLAKSELLEFESKEFIKNETNLVNYAKSLQNFIVALNYTYEK